VEIPASGYANTLAQSCHLSCLVATSLRIIASQKKISPGIKWSVLVLPHSIIPCCFPTGIIVGPPKGTNSLMMSKNTSLKTLNEPNRRD
jgi:hypothetical protein